MYKIPILISKYIIYNEGNLQKYILASEFLVIMEYLPYKCGNIKNCTVTNRNYIC